MIKTRLFASAVLLSFAFGSSGHAAAQDNISPELPTAQQKPAPAPSEIFRLRGGTGDHSTQQHLAPRQGSSH